MLPSKDLPAQVSNLHPQSFIFFLTTFFSQLFDSPPEELGLPFDKLKTPSKAEGLSLPARSPALRGEGRG